MEQDEFHETTDPNDVQKFRRNAYKNITILNKFLDEGCPVESNKIEL